MLIPIQWKTAIAIGSAGETAQILDGIIQGDSRDYYC